MRLLVLLGICSLAAWSAETPRMSSVDPNSGKPGTEITVSGEALSHITKLYLSDGKTDSEVKTTALEDKAVKFKIPDGFKAGRYGLAILTKDNRMIDQPVKVTVE